jgi:hypothetical protein
MATLIVVEDLAAPASLGRGGHAMYVLQWLHGLERLGHRVVFLEFLKEDPGESKQTVAAYFGETMSHWWHPDQCALLVDKTLESLYGLDSKQVSHIADEAAGVISLAAHYRREPFPLVDKIRPRILLEQDPAYTQLWALGGDPVDIYGEQDLYFTVGANIGSPRCNLPTVEIRWRPTWNPVVLDWWAKTGAITRDRFTTVGDWRSYGYLEFAGQILGPKAEEFRKFIALPLVTGETIELTLNIDSADPDREVLQRHGWRLENPAVVSTPDRYREYVMGSVGEFSCVKGGYAGTHCGWFSDRSACYLAAGRPVVLQATGFEDLLPTGKGLFAVKTVEEAAEAVKAIRRDYAMHAAAARAIAREHFDSDRVVGRMLREAELGGG